jgi:hypothetical protein
VNITPAADYYVNPKDNTKGIVYNGTLSLDESQGVHSLTDVPVFAMGRSSVDGRRTLTTS